MRTPALEQLVRTTETPRAEASDRCGLCGAPVPDEHRHLLDVTPESGARSVECGCRACSLLFQQQAASNGHYRLIPQRRRRLAPFPTQPLGVPVGLAFFVRRRLRGVERVVAHYPSPAGATEWDLDDAAWQRAAAACPPLGGLEAEVEACLVDTARGHQEFWIVPVDDCFRLVAIVRQHWRGLSGGSTVWPAIAEFFAGLSEQD